MILLLALLCQSETRLHLDAPDRILRPEGRMVLRFLVENAGNADAQIEEPESWTAGLEIVDPDGKAVKAPEKSKGTARTVPPGGFFGRSVDIGSALKVAEDREGWYRFKWTHAGATSSELRVLVIRDWVASIETTLGTIKVDFRPDLAPEHVGRFVKLAREGFYEGSTFHRVIPGFMMQGGKPKRAGAELPPPLKAEFSPVRHVFGTLAMARFDDPDSATNEFYLCFGPVPHLDNKYTVFGGLVEGHEVLKAVEKVRTDHNPCKGCGRVPAKTGPVPGCCGSHHADRPEADVIIKKVALSVRKS